MIPDMQFIKKLGQDASICLHCFLTVHPSSGQTRARAEAEHVCSRSENGTKKKFDAVKKPES
jgi:hypothetical protein